MNGRKLCYDLSKIRERQYRMRVGQAATPTDLCNQSDWDIASQKIWAKFEERTQPREMFEEKIRLWNSLRKEIEVCIVYIYGHGQKKGAHSHNNDWL